MVPVPKGYWIALANVTDPESYTSYQQLAPAVFARYGARFLARGEYGETLEGERWQRRVLIEFDSKAQALAYYNSAKYQDARRLRSAACTVIIEGLPSQEHVSEGWHRSSRLYLHESA